MEMISPRVPYYHGLTLIRAWISNDMLSKVWDEITYLFPNLNGCIIDIWERISNFVPHFIMGVISYPCPRTFWGTMIAKLGSQIRTEYVQNKHLNVIPYMIDEIVEIELQWNNKCLHKRKYELKSQQFCSTPIFTWIHHCTWCIMHLFYLICTVRTKWCIFYQQNIRSIFLEVIFCIFI